MDDYTQDTVRLLEQAQAGQAAEALAQAEFLLCRTTGVLADGPACLHFARAISLNSLGDLPAVDAALELMLAAADRERSPGWRACALGTRAAQRARVGETQSADYDLDGVLRDLVSAETFVIEEVDPVASVNARVAIANGFFELRLYELVGPHYEAAYQISAADRGQNGNRAMWLLNLAELHLHWALELYQVSQSAAAEEHTAQAEQYASRAAVEAVGADAEAWRDYALLSAACARADRHDPVGAVADIELHLGRLEARGMTALMLAFSRPFHAVALRRSGRPDEALRVIERAVETMPKDTGALLTAATHHTHAVLLAAQGSADARVGLAYGDTLAAALWQQRQRTLHSVKAIKSLEQLRIRHELASKAADLDALTGIANRRAFDEALLRAQTGPDALVTVLVIDTDKFKQINDTAGHAAGDAALRAIADALSGQISEHDMLARLGGDEFAVLLPDVGTSAGYGVAARMVYAVRGIPNCPATLSIGVADGHTGELPEIVRRADAAMYRMKRRGGDGVEECSEHAYAA
ncbi:diguanylate cyclase domain-containing protein [Micromonosporaceae bacterium Da 78-11]